MSAAERRKRAASLLGERVHALAPGFRKVDLTEDLFLQRRAICGDHGRVVPTRAGVCPHCAGYVEDAEAIERLRDSARALERDGVFDRENVGRIRLTPFFNPVPGVSL